MALFWVVVVVVVVVVSCRRRRQGPQLVQPLSKAELRLAAAIARRSLRVRFVCSSSRAYLELHPKAQTHAH
jgi:hypothetical protein